jgi:hypothetical protein
MNDKPVCELPKNSREVYQFRLAEFKGHRFADVRIFTKEDDQDPIPTKKGVAIAPTCGPSLRGPWPR